jgi:uncharacterized protein
MTNNVELLKEAYAAFNRGDIPAVLATFDPGIEWSFAEGHPYAEESPFVGPDEILQKDLSTVPKDFDGFTCTPHTYHDARDVVVVEGRYSATGKETGKTLDAGFCHVFGFRNGKMTRYQQYTDTAQMRAVMGVAPPSETMAGR